MEKEAKKTQPITEEICRKLELMMKGGADGVEAAKLVGISQSRASRIKRAGFSLEKYKENDRLEREAQKKKTADEPQEAPEQIQGQIEMDLTPAEGKNENLSEQTKMMRFHAHMTDMTLLKMEETMKGLQESIGGSAVLLRSKLDQLNDTLMMILRAMRKE